MPRKGVKLPLKDFVVRHLGSRRQSVPVSIHRPFLPPGRNNANQLDHVTTKTHTIAKEYPQHAARALIEAMYPSNDQLIDYEAFVAVYDSRKSVMYLYKFYREYVKNKSKKSPSVHIALKGINVTTKRLVSSYNGFEQQVRAETGEYIGRPGSGVVFVAPNDSSSYMPSFGPSSSSRRATSAPSNELMAASRAIASAANLQGVQPSSFFEEQYEAPQASQGAYSDYVTSPGAIYPQSPLTPSQFTPYTAAYTTPTAWRTLDEQSEEASQMRQAAADLMASLGPL